jgi:CHASE2 domain-containing sensor protein
LRFVPTSREPQLIRGDQELADLLSIPEFLSGRFLLVGDLSQKDTFKVPLNAATPGPMIHAYAVNALLAQHYITRPPAWFSAFVVIAACCILAVFGSQRAKPRTLLIVAGGLSFAVVALSAAAMALFLVWLDIIYALVAIWFLVPLLIAYQRIELKYGAGEKAAAGASDKVTLNADV